MLGIAIPAIAAADPVRPTLSGDARVRAAIVSAEATFGRSRLLDAALSIAGVLPAAITDRLRALSDLRGDLAHALSAVLRITASSTAVAHAQRAWLTAVHESDGGLAIEAAAARDEAGGEASAARHARTRATTTLSAAHALGRRVDSELGLPEAF